MPFGLGPTEVIIVLILALVVFGPKKLPEMARSVGKGIREFKSWCRWTTTTAPSTHRPRRAGQTPTAGALACRPPRPRSRRAPPRPPPPAARSARFRASPPRPWSACRGASRTRMRSRSSITSTSCATVCSSRSPRSRSRSASASGGTRTSSTCSTGSFPTRSGSRSRWAGGAVHDGHHGLALCGPLPGAPDRLLPGLRVRDPGLLGCDGTPGVAAAPARPGALPRRCHVRVLHSSCPPPRTSSSISTARTTRPRFERASGTASPPRC